MKKFRADLQNLYPHPEFYISVTAEYEDGEIIWPIKDEYGREWTKRELSIHDLQALQKELVLSLVADENEKAANHNCYYCGQAVCE